MRKIIQIMPADGWYAQIMNNGQEGLNTVEKILFFALIEDDNKTCVETYVDINTSLDQTKLFYYNVYLPDEKRSDFILSDNEDYRKGTRKERKPNYKLY
jgi:hypothetical protein